MSETTQASSEQGKQTIESLMAKMTPEQQEKFKEHLAGDKPVHVNVDKDGTVTFGEDAVAAAEAAGHAPVTPASEPAPTELKKEEPKRPSKLDMKRQQILMDRVRRHMGKGMTQQQAFQAIQREDYEALPLEKKFARLETMVSQSFQRLAQEIMTVSQDQMAIGDAFDINYRGIQKLFKKLGVSDEDQKALIDEAQKEVIEERKKQHENRMAQMKAAEEAAEKSRAEAELKKAEAPVKTNGVHEEVGAEVPKEATVFGG